MELISWEQFAQVELRVGRIIHAEPFPKARKPAYILHVDFGAELGIKNPALKSPSFIHQKL